jgi:hypothetical protein
MRAAILLLAALPPWLAPSPAAAADRGRSLVVANWSDDVIVSPCAAEPLCDVFVRKAPILNVRTLAGPPVPRKMIAYFGMHGTLPPGSRFVAWVFRWKGRWRAQWRGQVESRPDDCIRADLWLETGAPVPAQAYRKADEICFRP